MRPLRELATTRRGFLRLAGAAASLSALGQLRAIPAAAADVPAGETFLSASEREILTQVVERLVASDAPDAPAVRETRTVDTIENVCRGLDAAVVRPVPWLLRLVEYGPILFDWTPSRFTKLPPESQDAALRSWMDSRLALRRQGFQALRNLAFLGYYTQPETWPGVGYAGPLLPPQGPTP
ncbi:MAG: hypothetical protein ABFS46_20445 [Myxococcota bacterium]